VGHDPNGVPVRLEEIWPSPGEVSEAVAACVKSGMFREEYAAVFEGDDAWKALPVPGADTFSWDPGSTYIRKPPFFDGAPPGPREDIRGARALAVLGDSVTTDHISPAGSIPPESPAGRYLLSRGVSPADFNSYGSRRGNHEVMMRGTFANIRLRNLLVPGSEGGVTVHLPGGEGMTIFDAAMRYAAEGVPLIVLAGREYGSGSSRDWAAKGPRLLGVRAVLAESFERIHRANLVGMGVLPLQFEGGATRESLGLSGTEAYDVEGISGGLSPGKRLTVRALGPDGEKSFTVAVRADTPAEVRYYESGGILPYVLRRLSAP
jgi:aconitate hydratase